jgi:hypothetical protein
MYILQCFNESHQSDWLEHYYHLRAWNSLTSPYPYLMMSTKQGCQMSYIHTKNPNLVYFGRPWNGKFWHILWPSEYCIDIWSILWSFSMIIYYDRFCSFPFLVCYTKNNLATLLQRIFCQILSNGLNCRRLHSDFYEPHNHSLPESLLSFRMS